MGGNEQIIEGVHFLVFFFVCGYFVSLVISLVLSKLVIARRFATYEEIFHGKHFGSEFETEY
jgi:hypothetical protein